MRDVTARMPLFVALGLCLFMAGAMVAKGMGSRPEPRHTNVVLISIDTLRRDHLPLYGYARDTAPNLTRLASAGVTFDQAIAVHTNTAPSHASMMTGLHPATHGVWRNGMRLPDEVRTLAEVLRGRGFRTGAFVSGWTLTRHVGLDAGFEVYDDHLPGDGERVASDTVHAALPWMVERAREEQPFFLFVHLFDPHFPYAPPEDLARQFLPEGRSRFRTPVARRLERRKARNLMTPAAVEDFVARYDGEIAFADRQMGRLLDALEGLGVDDHTLVILTSDHGETLYEREWIFDHGGRVYDEQIRIPLVIRFPDGRGAGSRIVSQVSHVDLAPTVLSVLGAPPLEGAQGRSLVGLLDGETPEDLARPAFAHARPEPDRVPEMMPGLGSRGIVTAVRLPTIKLIEYPSDGDGYRPQLFELEGDPGETSNMAVLRPGRVRELHEVLDRFRADTGAERIGPPPELAPEIVAGLRALGYVD